MKPGTSNATRHGLLTDYPVLDGVETREAWLAHRQSFWDDLQPKGAVQETLVERIALTFWRMARVARAESAAAHSRRAREIERAGRVWCADVQRFLTSEEARDEVRLRDDVCDWLAAYHAHAASDPVPDALSAALASLLLSFLEEAEADEEGAAEELPPSLLVSLSSASRRPVTTASGIFDCFNYAALLTGRPLAAVLQHVTTAAQASAYTLARSVREAERQVEQIQSTVHLPADHDLQLFTRYDAHLGRELARLFRILKDLRSPSPSNSNSSSNSDPSPSPECPNARTPESPHPALSQVASSRPTSTDSSPYLPAATAGPPGPTGIPRPPTVPGKKPRNHRRRR